MHFNSQLLIRDLFKCILLHIRQTFSFKLYRLKLSAIIERAFCNVLYIRADFHSLQFFAIFECIRSNCNDSVNFVVVRHSINRYRFLIRSFGQYNRIAGCISHFVSIFPNCKFFFCHRIRQRIFFIFYRKAALRRSQSLVHSVKLLITFRICSQYRSIICS